MPRITGKVIEEMQSWQRRPLEHLPDTPGTKSRMAQVTGHPRPARRRGGILSPPELDLGGISALLFASQQPASREAQACGLPGQLGTAHEFA